MRIHPLHWAFLSSFALLTGCATTPWTQYSQPLPAGYTPPPLPSEMKFASAKTVKVTDDGALTDGKTLCTDAIKKAIDEVSAAGGGVVEFTKGDYLTGPIALKSNITLQIDEGAVLKFSADHSLFPIVKTRYESVDIMNFSPLIYADHCENIRITGKGTLDGNGKPWWDWKDAKEPAAAKALKASQKLMKKYIDDRDGKYPLADRVFGDKNIGYRPCFIEPYECKNFQIDGVTIRQSPFWNIHPLYTENVIVRGVTVFGNGANTDGCDPDSSRNVLIENCNFMTGDDCIAIKSGRDGDGIRRNAPCENITIRNCVMTGGHGAITMGSETSAGIHNVFAENCMIDGPDSAIRLKSTRGRGGGIEDVFCRNITVTKTKQFAITIDTRYGLVSTRFNPEPLSPALLAASKGSTTRPGPTTAAGVTFGSNASYAPATAPADDADSADPEAPPAPAPAFMPKNEKTPIFKNIRIENFTCGDSTQAIWILGLPEAPIENVTLKNIHIKADIGAHVENVAGFSADNVHIVRAPLWDIKNVSQ